MIKRIFWDVLIDSNSYRVFTTGWDVKKMREFYENIKSGEPLGERWATIQLVLWIDPDHPKREQKKPVADFMSAGIMNVISNRARFTLEPLIASQVEFLPFETPVGPYYGLHIKYVDCLDTSRIEAKYFGDGRIMRVLKYAFYWERLEGIHIFRLPELGLSRLFVSDEFKRVVEENGLTGLLFYPVPLVVK